MLKIKQGLNRFILIFLILIWTITINAQICGNGICEDGENHSNCHLDCSNPFGVFPDYIVGNGLNAAVELGNHRTRLILSWDMFEPSQGQFDFYFPDQVINEHYDANICFILTLKCNSSWGTISSTGEEASSLPLNWADYEMFLTTAVNRYKDKVKYWQIENEIYNYSKYWDGTAEEYIVLLQHAYNTIKQVDPDANIILQGFSNIMFRMIDEGNDTIQDFFEYIMDNGSDYFDIIDFHQYYEPNTVYLEVDILNLAMEEFGYTKPLICTEAGDLDLRLFGQHIMNPNSPIPVIEELLMIPEINSYLTQILENGVTEQEYIDFAILLKTNSESRPILEKYQAENLVKRISLTISQGVEQINWLAIIDLVTPVDWFFAMMGLLDSDGRKKPHYYTYKLLIEKLTDFESVTEITFAPKIIKFTFVDIPPVYVLWSDSGNTIVDFSPYVSTTNVKITHIVTELDTNNNPIYLLDEIVSANSIVIDGTPVFIEENSSSIVNDLEIEQINISPNPTTGIFTIKGKNIQSIEITNICGQLVETQNFVSLQNKTIDLSEQPKGVYFVKICTFDFIKIEKIIIQ